MVFFAEVAERGGFAAAGRALGVPKSRLSRHVAELEDSLGVQLLQRSTRRLSLTPAGEIVPAPLRRDARCSAGGGRGGSTGADRAAWHGAAQLSGHAGAGQRRPAAAAVHAAPSAGARRDAGAEPAGRPGRGRRGPCAARAPRNRGQRARWWPSASARAAPCWSPARRCCSGTGPCVGRRVLQGWTACHVGGGRALDAAAGRPARPRARAAHDTALRGRRPADAQVRPGPGHRRGHAARLHVSGRMQDGALVEVLPGWGPPPGIVHAVFPARRALVPAVRRLIDFLAENLSGPETLHPC